MIIENCIIITITALITWGFAWYFSERKKLLVKYDSTSVLKMPIEFDGLKLLYENKEIDELIHTKITFRNDGNKEIVHSMIVKNMIHINFTNCTDILKVVIDKKSNNEIDLRAEAKDNKVWIEFNFLDKNEEFTIIVLHVSKTNLAIEGKIIGCKIRIVKDYKFALKESLKFSIRISLLIGLPIAVFCMIFKDRIVFLQLLIGLCIGVILSIITVFLVIPWSIRMRENKIKQNLNG